MSETDGQNSEEWVMDDRVEKELDEAISDEDVIGAYITGGSGDEEKLDIIREYMPGGDEWQGKTIITKREAKAHALSKNLAKAFPTIRPMESFIEDSVNDLEMLYTSVNGQSRMDYVNILRALFGKEKVEAEEARSLAYTAIAGARQEDD